MNRTVYRSAGMIILILLQQSYAVCASTFDDRHAAQSTGYQSSDNAWHLLARSIDDPIVVEHLNAILLFLALHGIDHKELNHEGKTPAAILQERIRSNPNLDDLALERQLLRYLTALG